MRSAPGKSSRLASRGSSGGVIELVPLRKRIEELRRERDLIEKAIAALAEVSEYRYPQRRPDAG